MNEQQQAQHRVGLRRLIRPYLLRTRGRYDDLSAALTDMDAKALQDFLNFVREKEQEIQNVKTKARTRPWEMIR